MQPAQLTAAAFAGYPPEARVLATQQVELLRELPLVLVPILLRELIGYDWKLPAERRELRKQFTYLNGLSAADRSAAMAGFQSIPMKPELAATDWVNLPSSFLEQLTAWLWSAHQMDHFRDVADGYAKAVNQSLPEAAPAMPRMALVVIGAGVEQGAAFPLFRKLRPHGVYLTRVAPQDGLATLSAEISRRATLAQMGTPESRLLHWSIDGSAPRPLDGATEVSYTRLEGPRTLLLERIQRAIATGKMGPEELRSLLARMQPSDVGLSNTGPDALLNHFQLTLLTEGAGTQIFATTFVQWAARECIRRAHPESLLVRYTPRQEEQTLNTMLSQTRPAGVDAAGSLVDADMGAYYTWVGMRRLTGADQLRFLAWFEGHGEAVAIGPALPGGTTSDSPMDMHRVLALLNGTA